VGGYPDELVLDVLNDDLIAQVRNKLNSGGKDIFAQCVNAVKAFLAGEQATQKTIACSIE